MADIMLVMHSGTVPLSLCRALIVLALVTALALVMGVRPRALAQEVGVDPMEPGICFLCDGSQTAASIAPAADSTTPALLVMVMLPAVMVLLLVTHPGHHLGLGSAAPPPPPPRG